jgi:hypothetical protein
MHELLDVLVEQVAPQVPRPSDGGHCILASKAAIEFLGRAGVSAEPTVAEVSARNGELYEALLAGRQPGADAYEIAIRSNGIMHGFNGHLVAIAQQRYLVDLSIDQLNRPGKGVVVVPFWAELPSSERDAILAGHEEFGLLFQVDKTTTWLSYRMHPDRKDYAELPIWSVEITFNPKCCLRG